VTVGALALIVLVFSPWLAAWWARRVATQRRRRREARLQPHQNQLRDWFANGLFSEAEYRRTRERIARSIDGATTGELNHSIGQFLQAWATLILVGGLVFVGSFVLVALDTDAWQPLLTTAGIVLVGVVAGTVLLAIAGAAARRNATTRLRADSEELDGLLDELAIRIARPPKAKR
jgi:4-amino-4-deoxy-L-arabinose transferase-like glycosyltransferase